MNHYYLQGLREGDITERLTRHAEEYAEPHNCVSTTMAVANQLKHDMLLEARDLIVKLRQQENQPA